MLRTLAHYCSSTALTVSMHTHLVGMLSWRWRNQKAPVDGVLKQVANEDVILVSTGGADWLQGSCKAVKVEGGYRVTGRKIFCSGAPAGSLLMTTAVFDDPADGPTVLQIGIPMASAGVKVQDNWRTLGMRATGSHDITLDEVFVPDAAVSLKRKSGKWHPIIDIITLVNVPIFNAVYVGVAEAARETAIEMAERNAAITIRKPWPAKWTTSSRRLQLALARMVELAMTAQPSAANSAENVAVRALLGRATRACVDKAMELPGGNSLLRANKLERLFRDVREFASPASRQTASHHGGQARARPFLRRVSAPRSSPISMLKDTKLLRNQCYIDGAWCSAESGKTFPVVNPATGERLADVPDMGAAETRRAIDAACGGAARLAQQDRQRAGRASCADGSISMMAAQSDLAVSSPRSKANPSPKRMAKSPTVLRSSSGSPRRASAPMATSFRQQRADKRIVVLKEPIGVCGAITPWNFPIAMITRKIAPGPRRRLHRGAETAEQTPLSALAVVELADRAGMPRGVFNVVTGDAPADRRRAHRKSEGAQTLASPARRRSASCS